MSDDFDPREIIRRWLRIQRYSVTIANNADQVLKKMLKQLKEKIGDSAYMTHATQIARVAREELQEVYKLGFVTGGAAIATSEAAAIDGAAIKVTNALVGRALNRPLSSQNITPRQMFESSVRGAAERSTIILRRAFEEGLTVREARKELETAMLSTSRHAEAYARTGMNAVANQVKEETYEKNSDLVDRYLWVSTLDSRTSLVCMSLDGKAFKVGNGPIPPAHVNCRSATVPILKTESIEQVQREMLPRPAVEPAAGYERGDNKTRTNKPRKPSRGGKLKGTTVRNTTYETWLKQQPIAYQRDILGERGVERLKQGEKLSSILRSRTGGLTAADLERSIN